MTAIRGDSITWPPDWSKIPVGYDHAAVDSDGVAWAYPDRPRRIPTMWSTHFLGATHRIGFVTLPAGMTWSESYCKRPPVADDLAFLGLSWADVPARCLYVAADENGMVWGYVKPPVKSYLVWDGGPGLAKLATLEPGTFGDWEKSLRIRPSAMTDILGITWADVPINLNFVTADADGAVYGWKFRPTYPIAAASIWTITEPRFGVCFEKLSQATLPPNLDWRNTLFVRPGYTEL